VIKLIINILIVFIIFSCQMKNNNKIKDQVIEKKDIILEIIPKKKIISKINNKKNLDLKTIQYIIGEPYYIEGVKYKPEENYYYNEIGLASYYGKELHNIKTINNDLNKVTELLGRHKTLPIPSIVKITNLDNGLSLTIKINDRHKDNSSLIQVSRKVAQLLKFYKKKIAKVKLEILSDPSKQMKAVTKSMSELTFNDTIDKAPTEDVLITNIDNSFIKNKKESNIEPPIEIGFEEIATKDLFLKIYDFKSFDDFKSIISKFELKYNITTNKVKDSYTALIGPLENNEANNLVLYFISKGYNKTEFILE